ncbi:probable endoglucanase IV precursor [Rhynchosporium graminicola]|uniref:Probable endoglucanase IV n=1 Tax=Rhynchosporium graminicola TaxID=2792576 RepID=A0A1E1LL91_9HELO|nr:probable endoglucanase IV precursor [Rhynchosporium commune]
MFSKLSLLGLVSTVATHGTVSGIVADGIYYDGYNPAYQYKTPAPITAGWKTPGNLGNGFIAPDTFAKPDVICHIGATNAQTAASIKAGGKIQFQWTPWPTSHKGPVIEYLANCNGPCETVDKTKLLWTKISAVGLLNPTSMTNGYWATDQLIANNNSWTSVIPPTIATGNYVLRHEIIGLHAAGQANGAQDYPQCFNLAITGTGTDKLTSGILATSFMKSTDAGILFDLYSKLTSYTIPGPALYSGAVTISQTLPAKPTATATGVYTV